MHKATALSLNDLLQLLQIRAEPNINHKNEHI